MDRFSVRGEDTEIRAELDESRCRGGVSIFVDDEMRAERCGVILDPLEARGLAAWILEAVPPPDASPGRYCAICRHSAGPSPYLMCQHPVATHIDPVLGKATGKTATFMRAACRACGPAGKLFEPIPPTPAAD